MRPRLCSHPGAISRWFLYTRADKHGSGGDSCPGCGVWLVTSNILSSVWALCPKSLCLLVLRVKALHINLRKSTKDPCFFNYKIHTFFFLSFNVFEIEMCPTNDDDIQFPPARKQISLCVPCVNLAVIPGGTTGDKQPWMFQDTN